MDQSSVKSAWQPKEESMEPKVIKEEVPERDSSSSCKELSRRQPTPTPSSNLENMPSRGRHKGVPKERVKTPDSPEGARLMLSTTTPTSNSNHSNSTSPPGAISTTTPPTTTLSSALRYATSGLQNGVAQPSLQTGNISPGLNGSGGSRGSLSPPLPASTALSLSMLEAQNSTSPGMRTLGKMKRFLSTLVQFGGDISPETGERVRSLVFSLVGNAISIEEFHHSLQDVTNFPLRPFVVPFLRSHLPLLQRELNNLARAAKQSPQQYLRHHEHVVLDPAFSPSEPSEIFHSEATTENGKRRASSRPDERTVSSEDQTIVGLEKSARYYENGLASSTDTCTDYMPTPKRHHPILLQHGAAPGLLFSPSTPSHPLAAPPHLHPSADYHQYYQYPVTSHSREDFLADRRHGDDEWKNIHVMLNCILSMVEKTKRALAILQHRGSSPPENGTNTAEWLRRSQSESSDARDIKRTAGEIMAQTIRATEDRVAEVKRRAEEAVNEVKRQAVAELQRAVSAAESKACELVASERSKMEKLLLEARKQAAEEALAAVVANQQQAESSEPTSTPTPTQQNSCWNCGRKANETCSGCNMARYCGAFCQHKDWENHHQVCCGRSANPPAISSDKTQPSRSANSSRSATPVTASSSTNGNISAAETRTKK